MSELHPEPWVLALIQELGEDPVISLERRDEPTHALVLKVYSGLEDEAIVEVKLIDSPPPPIAPTYGGSFEARAFDAPSELPERPWFVFERSLSTEQNIARLRTAARDCVFHTGRRESPPMCVDEVPDPMEPPRPSFEDMSRTQRVQSQPPPSRPPSSKALPTPPKSGPGSQRAPSSKRAPAPHRAPPRRRNAPPEPPPPAPAFTGEPPPAISSPAPQPLPQSAPSRPPPSRPPPPRRNSSVPPPPARRVPTGPIPGPPPIPVGAAPDAAPMSGGLPPPPPPPPPPPFGEEEV